jgi:hypothetical protein
VRRLSIRSELGADRVLLESVNMPMHIPYPRVNNHPLRNDCSSLFMFLLTVLFLSYYNTSVTVISDFPAFLVFSYSDSSSLSSISYY